MSRRVARALDAGRQSSSARDIVFEAWASTTSRAIVQLSGRRKPGLPFRRIRRYVNGLGNADNFRRKQSEAPGAIYQSHLVCELTGPFVVSAPICLEQIRPRGPLRACEDMSSTIERAGRATRWHFLLDFYFWL